MALCQYWWVFSFSSGLHFSFQFPFSENFTFSILFCPQFMRILLILLQVQSFQPGLSSRGPLQALREEALWRLAVVHLCVTTNTSGVPLSERSPKFGQPSWSSLFLLPSADFSTCLFFPVVITSCYLGHSFPSLLFSCPVPSDPLWPRGLQHARPPLSLTSPRERGSSQYL